MKFLIVAGDPSGGIHAARLMHELRDLLPDVEFYGIGNDDMISAGLDVWAHVRDVGIVGFWEVVKRYGFFRKLLASLKDSLTTEAPDAVLLVDYPGFNLRLAAEAKQHRIPVLYYIAPQLWAWGSNRAKKLAGLDLLLTVFPFETTFFSALNIPVEFVGHPLLDDHIFDLTDGTARNKRKIALLPGSRAQEVTRNLPLMMAACSEFSERHENFTFSIAIAPAVPAEMYEKITHEFTVKSHLKIEFTPESRYLLKTARAGLIKTGTSTLEACLCNLPFAMMYKASRFSYYFGRMVVKTPFVAMPNILAQKEVIREFIQYDATPAALAAELERLVFDENTRQQMTDAFSLIRAELGGKGASKRAAEKIVAWMQNYQAKRNA